MLYEEYLKSSANRRNQITRHLISDIAKQFGLDKKDVKMEFTVTKRDFVFNFYFEDSVIRTIRR